MNDARLRRLAADGDELWDRAIAYLLGEGLGRISDQMTTGLVSGGAGDGGGPRPWCWTHERNHSACLADDELDASICSVETLTTNDPVGEAATTPDRAAADRRRVEALVAHHARAADELVRILSRYRTRPATDKERAEAGGGDVGCWSCARLPSPHIAGENRWEPGSRRVIVDNESRDLCSWCDRWHRSTGHLPPKDVLERHHQGERIRLPVGA